MRLHFAKFDYRPSETNLWWIRRCQSSLYWSRRMRIWRFWDLWGRFAHFDHCELSPDGKGCESLSMLSCTPFPASSTCCSSAWCSGSYFPSWACSSLGASFTNVWMSSANCSQLMYVFFFTCFYSFVIWWRTFFYLTAFNK